MARVLLQFPEGLKQKAVEEAKKLERKGNEVFLSSSPCYGGCDVAFEEARALKADKIIHYGHSAFLKDKQVEFIEYRLEVEWKQVMEKALAQLKNFKRIGLVTTVQHVGQLKEIKRFLEENGKKVFVGKGKLANYEGQVLGCDAGAASSIAGKVDCFVYFGGGLFHPLALPKGKRVLSADPFAQKTEWLDERIAREEKRRKASLAKALLSKKFGVIVSTKRGQFNLKKAEEAKKTLEKTGREAFILVSNEISFESLQNFLYFECFVNTACPRIRGDAERLGKPIVNWDDLKPLLSKTT